MQAYKGYLDSISKVIIVWTIIRYLQYALLGPPCSGRPSHRPSVARNPNPKPNNCCVIALIKFDTSVLINFCCRINLGTSSELKSMHPGGPWSQSRSNTNHLQRTGNHICGSIYSAALCSNLSQVGHYTARLFNLIDLTSASSITILFSATTNASEVDLSSAPVLVSSDDFCASASSMKLYTSSYTRDIHSALHQLWPQSLSALACDI